MEFSRDINNLPLLNGEVDKEILEMVVLNDVSRTVSKACMALGSAKCGGCSEEIRSLCHLMWHYKDDLLKGEDKAGRKMGEEELQAEKDRVLTEMIDIYEGIVA
jgi:hypothetical protein